MGTPIVKGIPLEQVMAIQAKRAISNTVGSVASNVLMDRYDLNPYVAMGIGIGISGLTNSGLETIGNTEYINEFGSKPVEASSMDKTDFHSIPRGENLKMSKTVQNHINDIIKRGRNSGQLSRPYIDSNGTILLLDEIMAAGEPIKDAVLSNGLRWDINGKFRGTAGTWELVIDMETNTVVHFNFVTK